MRWDSSFISAPQGNSVAQRLRCIQTTVNMPRLSEGLGLSDLGMSASRPAWRSVRMSATNEVMTSAAVKGTWWWLLDAASSCGGHTFREGKWVWSGKKKRTALAIGWEQGVEKPHRVRINTCEIKTPPTEWKIHKYRLCDWTFANLLLAYNENLSMDNPLSLNLIEIKCHFSSFFFFFFFFRNDQ